MKEDFWRGKLVVITGANGFLASHLTVALLEKGAKVIGIIKEKIPKSFLNLSLKINKYKDLKIYKGNIANHAFIQRIFRLYKPDVFIWLPRQLSGKPINLLCLLLRQI